MLGEIVETFTDLVDLADRNLTKLFSEPWPPVDTSTQATHRVVYVKQRVYHSGVHIDSFNVSRSSTTIPSRTSKSSHYKLSPQTKSTSPRSRSEAAHRPEVSLRRSTTVDDRRGPPHARAVSAPVSPRPSSTPASKSSSDLRERRTLIKPGRPYPRGKQSLSLDEVKPDLVQCDVLVIAVAEMEICKEIFNSWRAQLNLGKPRKSDKLELAIISTVGKLDVGASAALHTSHSLLRDYRTLLHTIERNLDRISHSRDGGNPFSTEISALALSISAHSKALTNYIKHMQERLRTLVKNIEKTKESADKRALRRKIWHWLSRAFQALAALLSVGGAIFGLLYPIGFLESAAIGGASMLSGAASRLCGIVRDRYNETTFDEILTFLRSHIPESAQAAEIALTSFQACHRILQVELEIRRGKRSGWVSAQEAQRARGHWAQAEQRLRIPNSKQ